LGFVTPSEPRLFFRSTKMARYRREIDSRNNPKQIKDEKEIPGKVISLFKTGFMDDLRIEFTDGTFVIVKMDYSSCYYEGDRPDLAIETDYRE
jgi:hypothetical protein